MREATFVDISSLAAVDLNLLVALHVLLEEQSTTGAARRMGRTQSAMSHALARLRETLNDPVLVRSGASMVPTPRALEIQAPLRDLLQNTNRLLIPPGTFSPVRSKRTFTLVTNDFLQAVLLPKLTHHLHTLAPDANLKVLHILSNREAANAMARGELDITTMIRNIPTHLHSSLLLEDDFVSLVAPNHPFTGSHFDLTSFCAWPHVLTSPGGTKTSYLGKMLTQHGLERRIALIVPHFLIGPRLLHGTHRILSLPRSAASILGPENHLRTVEFGHESPRFQVHMTWHERVQHDPAHTWFREQIRQSCPSLSSQ